MIKAFPHRILTTDAERVLPHLVTEDLDLRVRPVQRLVAAVVVAVRVDLDHQRKTLDPFLRGEVRTQTVDCDENLPGGHRDGSGETVYAFFCFLLLLLACVNEIYYIEVQTVAVH